jgi:Na+-transporting NADH:ubiquinone oxidoreductase subunit NqrB
MDPRNYQIAVLCTFVALGRLWLGFDFTVTTATAVIATALLCQWLLFGSQLKSALISSLSLVLLLRTDTIWLAMLAAVIAIVSKKYITIHHRHVFNPSALALVVVTMLFSGAWLAPGQWGPMGLSALLLAGAGLLVVTRAQRLDVALAFFITFGCIVVLRGVWLGDPTAIALHSLQNGALIVFAFFMITDPKTTPSTLHFRVLHGVSVAVVAALLQFQFYVSSAPLFALVILSPLVALFLYSKETANEKTIVHTHAADRPAANRTGLRVLRILRRQS